MAVEDQDQDQEPPKNLMEVLLSSVREKYIEEHGEEPSEEFMRQIRNEFIHGIASQDREEHRDIYDALANE